MATQDRNGDSYVELSGTQLKAMCGDLRKYHSDRSSTIDLDEAPRLTKMLWG
jgi:hypothetical protein